MHRFTRWSVCLLLSVLVTPAATDAQQSPRMVTEEFLRAFFGTDAAVLVGELAADLEGVIDLPEGSRVIGSIVYSERSRAFFTVVDDAESVVGFFRARLVADGWRAPEERPNPRGFQRPETTGSSETFCGPAREVLTISAAPDAGTTIAHLRYYAEYPGPRLPCDRPSRTPRREDLEQRMPILNVPPGEFQRSTGTGATSGTRSTAFWLRSERNAAQIAEGLASELEAAGWTAGFGTGGDDAAVSTWTRTFEDGAQARGVLSVIELEPGVYESLFRLITISSVP